MRAAALLLADARLPTGGYAHSGGLEASLRDGVATPADVAAFLRGRLWTVGATEAALAAAAARTADPATLAVLDLEARARCPSPPLRAAASALGRGVLRTGARIWPHDATLTAYREASEHTPRPVAFGVVGRAGGLAPEDVARVVLHDDLAGVAAAAVKLLPVDAAGAMRAVAELGRAIDDLAVELAAPCAPEELPSWSAPLVDARSLSHHHDERRLFAT